MNHNASITASRCRISSSSYGQHARSSNNGAPLTWPQGALGYPRLDVKRNRDDGKECDFERSCKLQLDSCLLSKPVWAALGAPSEDVVCPSREGLLCQEKNTSFLSREDLAIQLKQEYTVDHFSE